MNTSPVKPDTELNGMTPLLDDLHGLIRETRSVISSTVNAGLTLLYWRIGKRIREDMLESERAEYGRKVVTAISQQLSREYGAGFSEKNLRRMMQFAEVFPDEEIVVSLIRQLSWTHFLALIPLKDALQRDFYAEMCRVERWSTRTLRQKIDSMLYERTALSRKPEALIREELDRLREEDRLTPDLVFRDPYVLEFLGLKDRYLEKDLEDVIMRELENFLLELGSDFTFVARQKRISADTIMAPTASLMDTRMPGTTPCRKLISTITAIEVPTSSSSFLFKK